MKTNAKTRKLPAEFGPETPFEVRPVAAVSFRAVLENALEALKSRLLADCLATARDGVEAAALRRAAHEAVSLSRTTPFPLLVFPALFEEKARVGVGVGRMLPVPATGELAAEVAAA